MLAPSVRSGYEQLIIEAAVGRRITLNDGAASMLIEDMSRNSSRLEGGKVTVSTPGKETWRRWDQGDDGSIVDFRCAEYCEGKVIAIDNIRTRIVEIGIRK